MTNKRKREVSFTSDELETGKFVLENKRRKDVVKKLLESPMYFNQLCKQIGGSRSTIANALDDLVGRGLIEFKWQILEEEGPKFNPAPFNAVKMFRIKDKYVETLKKLDL